MSPKCTKISFGKINRYIFLIFIGAIFRTFFSFLEGQSTNFDDENKHPIVFCLTYSIGLCLNFILVIILKIRNKSAKKLYIEKEIAYLESLSSDSDTRKSVKANVFSNLHIKPTCKKEKFLWILIVSIIDYISYVIYSISWISTDNYLNTWGITIGFISIFSYKILQIKLYKHHFLCIIFIIIEGILFNIIGEKFSKKNFMKNYPYYISFLSTEIIFSLVFVIYKYMMYKKYIKAYEILFFQGIIETILGVITLIITTKIGKIDNFFDFIRSLDGKEIGIFIALIVNQFIVYSIQITVIDIFSPFHVFLLNILEEFFLFFFMIKSYNSNLKLIITNIVCIIICLVLILIFIEIIELNFCGLSYMTKKNIELRAKLDSEININDLDKKVDYEGYSLTFKNDTIKVNDVNELITIERDSISGSNENDD